MNFEPDDYESNNPPTPPAEIVDATLATPIAATVVNDTSTTAQTSLSLGGLLAWFVIVTLTVGVFAMLAVEKTEEKHEHAPDPTGAELSQIEIQGKVLLAQRELVDGAGQKPGQNNNQPAPKPASAELQQLDVGTYNQRLCVTILTNELQGPQAAEQHLETTDQRVAAAEIKLTDQQQQIREIIGRQLEQYSSGDLDAKDLSTSDENLLKEELGWFGELIAVPPGVDDQQRRQSVVGQATTAMFMFGGVMIVGVLALIVGFLIALLLIVLAVMGKIRSRFQHQVGRHNIYAETFAIWMVIFFVGQIPFGLALEELGIHDELSQMTLMPVLFFGSLLALAWPVVRGIPFRDVRQDIGWTFGNPVVEAGIGGIAYAALLPALAFALLTFIILMANFGPQQSSDNFSNSSGPSHPIQEYIAQGDVSVFAMVLVLACVAAPIVEETMFRGVFYRHLRDLSARWQRWVSVGMSCLINSFVFASIHPQGLLGIPLLMTLAVGFSLVREWRGSLWAPMLMHALNNFLMTTLAFFVM